MSVARIEGDTATVLEDAEALLILDDVPLVPERNNYEELMNSIQQSADYFVEKDNLDVARNIIGQLAGRFPNTTLASKLNDKSAAITEAAVGKERK